LKGPKKRHCGKIEGLMPCMYSALSLNEESVSIALERSREDVLKKPPSRKRAMLPVFFPAISKV
jgi:hypothetical protein